MSSLVAKLRWGGRATKVVAALDAAGVRDGLVAVLDSVALADVLVDAAGGRSVALVSGMKRAPKSRASVHPRSAPGQLPFEDAALAAVVAPASVTTGLPLAEIVRALRPGGAVVVVGVAPPEQASRAVLCAGFIDIEQRGEVTSARRPGF